MAARPQYFVVRPDIKHYSASSTTISPGVIVPLIALDELPLSVEIDGVPRELTVEQTDGLINVGTLPRDGHVYGVKMTNADHRRRNKTQQALVDNPTKSNVVDAKTSSKNTNVASSTLFETSGQANDPSELMRSATPRGTSGSPANRTLSNIEMLPCADIRNANATTAGRSFVLPTSPYHKHVVTTTNNSGTDVRYCRHWCRHGTCKWGIGCRFAHKMPETPTELAKAGLAGYPAWWTTAVLMASGCDMRLARDGSLGMAMRKESMGQIPSGRGIGRPQGSSGDQSAEASERIAALAVSVRDLMQRENKTEVSQGLVSKSVTETRGTAETKMSPQNANQEHEGTSPGKLVDV